MSNLNSTLSFFTGQREGAIQMGESVITDLNVIITKIEAGGEISDEVWNDLTDLEDDLRETVDQLKEKQ